MTAKLHDVGADSSFVTSAIRRKRVSVTLSVIGVVLGLGLGTFYAVQKYLDPSYPIGLRFVLVILILLNARQNLRQYRYALALEQLTSGRAR